MNTTDRIRDMVRMVERDPPGIGVLSMGERIAVALVLNEPALLPTGWTILDAVERLGPQWLVAALEVQRQGWREE